jgi:hypothetical protein
MVYEISTYKDNASSWFEYGLQGMCMEYWW